MARSASRSRKLPGTAPAWAVTLLAALAPQLLGGATDTTALVILVLACAVCIWTSLSLRAVRRSLRSAPFAALAMTLLALWTLVQALPVPCSLIEWAQPDRARVNEQLASLHTLTTVRCSISMAPGASRIGLSMLAVMAALLLSAAGLARIGHRELISRGVAASSVAMAFVAVAHSVFDAKQVFGVYSPQHATPGFLLAPLLNANHLAGLLALGLPLCLSYGLKAKRMDERVVWLGLTLLVLTAGLLTLSRGGTLVLVVGVVAFWVLRPGTQHANARQAPLWVRAGLGCVAVGATYLATDLMARSFEPTPVADAKWTQMESVFQLALQHPWLGIGRGALPDLSPTVIHGDVRAWFAENIVLQWCIDFGVPVAVVALGLLAISIASLRARSHGSLAMTIGVAALLLQNLVDFSLELPGVATTFSIALGALLGKETPLQAIPLLSRIPLPKLRPTLAMMCALATATTLAALPFLTTRSRRRLELTLRATLNDDPDTFAATFARALDAYPMDPTFLVLGAAQAVRHRSALAAGWLNLAMERAPGWPSPHAQAAYWLEGQDRLDQAALEIGFTLEREPESAWALSCDFLQRHPSARLAWSAFPAAGSRREHVAVHLARCLAKRAPPRESERFVADALELFPRSPELLGLAVDLALQAQDVVSAVARAQRMLQMAPRAPDSSAAMMRALRADQRAADALDSYDNAPVEVRGARSVLLEALSAAAVTAPERLDALVDLLLTKHAATSDQRASINWLSSVAYEQASNLPKALLYAQAAYDLGHDSSALERVHGLAVRAGVSPVALRAASELCHLRYRGRAFCGGSPDL